MKQCRFLSGNALKLIAAVAMTIDHAGLLLFPRIRLLRILGRIAFPIFAFMIAEGCRYTRSPRRYFLSITALAAVCQIVYFFAAGGRDFSILTTFSLSILMLNALFRWKAAEDAKSSRIAATVFS